MSNKYMYCEYEGATINVDPDDHCHECNEEDCSMHPDYASSARSEKLERFRSSEFAADVLTRMSTAFHIEPETAASRLEKVLVEMQHTADAVVRDMVLDAVRCRMASTMQQHINELVARVFSEAIEADVLVLAKDGTSAITTVQKRITDAVKKMLDKDTSGNRRSRSTEERLDAVIDRILSDKIDTALTEIKEEAINKFNKEAMKKMMAGMVGAIQGDRRLLAVLAE